MIGDRRVVKISEGGYWPPEMIGMEFDATEDADGDLIFNHNYGRWGASQQRGSKFPCEIISRLDNAKTPAHDDAVNPSHYKRSKEILGVEVYDILKFFFFDSPDKWNAGKYLLRAGHKDSELTDLKKSVWYLTKRIEQLETED